MKSFFRACAFFALGAVAQYPDPFPCFGVCDDANDPSLIQRASDGTWFRFATSNRVSIYSAPSGMGPWVYQGSVLPNCSIIQLPGNCDIWAPDVSKVGDTYYLYYSVSVAGSQNSAIGVATSASLDAGTWTDHGSTGLQSDPSKDYNTIDGTLIVADNKPYLTFGSFWNDLFNIEMQEPPLKIQASAPMNHLAFNGTGAHSLEGSYLYLSQGFYYLFFSSGICCGFTTTLPPPGEEYKIMVCRSESPVSGFVDANGKPCTQGGGTEVLASHDFVYAPGGQGVYVFPGVGPVLYYHYNDKRVGLGDNQKLLGINSLDFSSGWPKV